jgi:hypothetical protein
MTQLPAHLQERIEQASENLTGHDLHIEWIKRGRKDSDKKLAFLAGASFLYSLLKEEKGEVGRWVKASDRFPHEGWYGPIRYRYDEKYKQWEYDSEHSRSMQNNIENYPDVEWLDTSTPIVAGCGDIETMIQREPVTFFLVNALKYLNHGQRILLIESLRERTIEETEQQTKTP